MQPFESCNDFLDFVKKHAIERVGPYGLGGSLGERSRPGGIATSEAADVVGGGGPVQDVDFSGTNLQVAGVDEADVVKTDGERIFFVARGHLYWIDATGVPEIVASIPLQGLEHQLFLSGDRLLVMTSGYDVGLDLGGDEGTAIDIVPVYPLSQRVVLTEVDVATPESMEAVTTLMLDGMILSSRMADGTIRVVVRSGPVGFDWVFPEGSGIRAERRAIEANKKLIENSTLENWVPWYVLKDHRSGTTADGALLGCDQVGYPDEFSGFSMMTILTINLDDGLDPGTGIGLLAEGQTVYASAENLYVATSPWMAWPPERFQEGEKGDSLWTQIHMFSISDPGVTRHVATGEVEGVLHSQWAMDEYEGTLRVVVTDKNRWWGASDTDVPDTSVVTMQPRGDTLVKVGAVDGLGKNEWVSAVRFIQDMAYVVTFRQVDPLYVVDLSDPTDPVLKGEVKINGYSAYLHPIGEDLLLGVGQDATSEGRLLGTQVSVFDVSDPTDPKRVAKLTFDDGRSDAEWDHRAFLWWAPEGIAVLPLQRWAWDEQEGKADYFSGALVLTATSQRVKQIGEINHPYVDEPGCMGCDVWFPPISRSLVIGDTLFTFSETGALASDRDTLDDIAWMPFS